MLGIDLNQPIEYCYASMRCFKEGEHHVTRICHEDVLLLVFEGVLRFEEDGVSYEIYPGQYHIQKRGSFQRGVEASSVPQYLYVHFIGNWSEKNEVLPKGGYFSAESMFENMKKMDYLSHNDYSLIERSSIFFQLLAGLYQTNQITKRVNHIADYISQNLQNAISLEILSSEFNYSKNHIINLFKKEYYMTPVEYLIHKRIERAEWLLESTDNTMEVIAEKCGFSDYSHLYKAFVKAHGKTPGQWRRDKYVYPFQSRVGNET